MKSGRCSRGIYLNLRNAGFADVVFLLPFCKKPAVVVELKYDRSAETALQQIKDRRCAQALEGCSGEVLLVGISYDKENKPHSCVIEKLVFGAERSRKHRAVVG